MYDKIKGIKSITKQPYLTFETLKLLSAMNDCRQIEIKTGEIF